jgi:alkylation response protein AidB-like acyl-CoA dehydrogenase
LVFAVLPLVICLAITEPSAGSDVANLKTTAVKTPDGKHYIVNGEKKVSELCEDNKCLTVQTPTVHVPLGD